MKRFQCGNCGQIIEVPRGISKPPKCLKCGAPAAMIHRINRGAPGGRGGPIAKRIKIIPPIFCFLNNSGERRMIRVADPTKGHAGLEDTVSEVFGKAKTFTSGDGKR